MERSGLTPPGVEDCPRRRNVNLGMISADKRGWRLASLSRVETDGSAGDHV